MILNWNKWSIKKRFMAAALLPVVIIYFSLSIVIYFTRMADLNDEIELAGNFYAKSIALNLKNFQDIKSAAAVEKYFNDLINLDDSLNKIEYIDRNKIIISSVQRKNSTLADLKIFQSQLNENNLQSQSKTLSDAGFGTLRIEISNSVQIHNQNLRFAYWSFASLLIMVIAYFLGRKLETRLANALRDINVNILEISKGNYQVELKVTEEGEVGAIQQGFNQMAHQIFRSTQELENKIKERTVDLQFQRDWMSESNYIKTTIINKMNVVVEHGRKELASQLHDDLNGELVGARMPLYSALRLVESLPQQEIKTELIQSLNLAQNSLSTIHNKVRKISRRLCPESMEIIGLKNTIENLIGEFTSKNAFCHFSFNMDADIKHIENARAMAIYRVVEECLSNVVKHSNANTCEITLRKFQKNYIYLEISDDGKGYENIKFPDGITLISMRERIESFNGTICFESSAGKGTQVKVLVPMTIDIPLNNILLA